jgi:hypothetical protein
MELIMWSDQCYLYFLDKQTNLQGYGEFDWEKSKFKCYWQDNKIIALDLSKNKKQYYI